MHKFKDYGKDQHKNKSATTVDIGPVETAIIGSTPPNYRRYENCFFTDLEFAHTILKHRYEMFCRNDKKEGLFHLHTH